MNLPQLLHSIDSPSLPPQQFETPKSCASYLSFEAFSPETPVSDLPVNPRCINPIGESSTWSLQKYLDYESNGPWSEKMLGAREYYYHGSESLSMPVHQGIPRKMPQDPSDLAMRHLKGHPMQLGTLSNHGLPTPPEMDIDTQMALFGVPFTEVPQNYGGAKPRSSGYSKTSRGGSKSHRRDDSGSSRGTNHSGSNGDDRAENYIPSSQSKGKNRSGSGPDFACWFFKQDPIKYVDCMHIRGRSSDLKYAHLKHHFRNGVPPEFDKNMSWDEVWSTLFPGLPPPQNKFYVINDMIMSILESSQVEGDDVARFISALEGISTSDELLNRMYSFSRESSKSSPKGSGKTRKTQRTQLPSFDRIARTVGKTEAEELLMSPSARHRLGLAAMQAGGHNTYGSSDFDMLGGGNSDEFDIDPSLSCPQEMGKVLIFDEQCNTIWLQKDLPSPDWPWFDFHTFYLEHECAKSGGTEHVHIHDFHDLAAEYDCHRPGEIGSACHFTLFAVRRPT